MHTTKYQDLKQKLHSLGSVVVAFSGGVDSSLLLHACQEALGRERVLAVIGRSPSLAPVEYQAAEALAQKLGARLKTIDVDELDNPQYQSNPPHRCYICKSTLFALLGRVAEEEGLQAVVEGSNHDDLSDHRPGMQAARDLGVRAPLQEAGLNKAEIRKLAREQGLSVWDKPSLACLASRIPYGSPITLERLERIARSEEVLAGLGMQQVRVRDHGEVARIEVGPDELPRLLDPELRRAVVKAFKEAGWAYVALDLEGYRSGAMNEVLSSTEKTGAGAP